MIDWVVPTSALGALVAVLVYQYRSFASGKILTLSQHVSITSIQEQIIAQLKLDKDRLEGDKVKLLDRIETQDATIAGFVEAFKGINHFFTGSIVVRKEEGAG